MAGHQMFHDATVRFTSGYVSSLPRKLTDYANIMKSNFKLLLVNCENEGFACTGTIKNIVRFYEEFPKHVSDEEKRAVNLILEENRDSNQKKDKIIVGLDCPECEFSTHEILSYRKHVHGHKATLETGHEMNFSCSKCKEKQILTKDLNVYIRHMKTIHGDKKTVLCEKCGLSFKRKDALRNHKLHVHSAGPKKDFVCEICHKRFRCNAHLISHQSVHDKEKRFACDQCQSKFKTQSARDKHVTYTHENPKAYKCDLCARTFTTRQNLARHIEAHEKELQDNAAAKQMEISHQLALHIQQKFQQVVPQDDTVSSIEPGTVSNINSNTASLANSIANSPTRSERPPLVSELSIDKSIPHEPQQSQPINTVFTTLQTETTDQPTTPLPQSVHPSRPPSPMPQYSSSFTTQRVDNTEGLDEIFPQSTHEPVEENFTHHFETVSHQEELDSVFRQDVCHPNPHQISQPSSVSSHHPDLTDPRATTIIDSLIPSMPLRMTCNQEAVVASPQSGCSNQYNCQSRPPSVGTQSQHTTFHEQTPMASYASSPYNIPPPEMVFSQPICGTDKISHNVINELAHLYEKSNPSSPCIAQPMHFTHDNSKHNDFPTMTLGTPCSFETSLQHSVFTDQYGGAATPLYTNTSASQDCVTINSNNRCVTPQNFSGTHTYDQSTPVTEHRVVNDFNNSMTTTDTLLLPTANCSNGIVPQLHTPNKHFPDNESAVTDFSNILGYTAANNHTRESDGMNL